MTFSGSFEEKSLLKALQEAASGEREGRLEIHVGNRTYDFYLRQGALLGVLIDGQCLANDQLLAAANSPQRVRQLRGWLTSRTADAIVHLLAWKRGTFAFAPEDTEDAPLPIELEVPDTVAFLKALVRDVRQWRASVDEYDPEAQIFHVPLSQEPAFHTKKEQEAFAAIDNGLPVRRVLERLARLGHAKVSSYVLLHRWQIHKLITIGPESPPIAEEHPSRSTGSFSVLLSGEGHDAQAKRPPLRYQQHDELDPLIEEMYANPDADRLQPDLLKHLRGLLKEAVEEDDWDIIVDTVKLYLPDYSDAETARKTRDALAEIMGDIQQHASDYTFITVGERLGDAMMKRIEQDPGAHAPAVRDLMVIAANLNFTPLAYYLAQKVQTALETSPTEELAVSYIQVLTALHGVIDRQEYERLQESILKQSGRHLEGLDPATQTTQVKAWVQLLALLPGDGPVGALKQALKVPEVARAAAPLLAGRHDLFLPTLIEVAKTEDSLPKSRAMAEVLRLYGGEPTDLVEDWVTDSDWRVRRNAASILVSMGRRDQVALADGLLRDESQAVRSEALEASVRLRQGNERDTFLLTALRRANVTIRPTLMGLVGHYGGEASAKRLHGVLRSFLAGESSLKEAIEAIKALGEIAHPGSFPILRKLLTDERYDNHRNLVTAVFTATEQYLSQMPNEVTELWEDLAASPRPAVAGPAVAKLKAQRENLKEHPLQEN